MSGTGLIAVTYDVHCRDHTASAWGECANRECILAYESQIEIAALQAEVQRLRGMVEDGKEALRIILVSRGLLSAGEPEIREEISAVLDVSLVDADLIRAALLAEGKDK